MKHKIILNLLVFFLAGHFQAAAQGGFFSQQSDKAKLMLAQIAAYETYLSSLKKAYQITGKGLTAAHELKGGTFQLHSDYFSSLSQVAPAVRDDPKGKAIAEMQAQLISQLDTEIRWQQEQKLLSTTEITYLRKVADNLRAKARLDMEELSEVLTPGKLQLSDAGRLQRLDRLYAAMKDKKAFAAYFTAKCRKLALGRQKEKQEKARMKELYGIQ